METKRLTQEAPLLQRSPRLFLYNTVEVLGVVWCKFLFLLAESPCRLCERGENYDTFRAGFIVQSDLPSNYSFQN